MMDRRIFLSFGAAFVLTGCVGAPLLEEEVARNIAVQQVAVDVSALKGVSGRNLDISTAQIETDVRRALERRVLGQGVPRGTPVRVDVRVKSVALVGAGQSLLVGGSSTISADVSLVDISTGTRLVQPTNVTGAGGGYAPGGVIGAVTRASPEDDYVLTLRGFADNVAKRLLAGVQTSAPSAGTATPGTAPVGGYNRLRPPAWQL
jgi:hypothetical protein